MGPWTWSLTRHWWTFLYNSKFHKTSQMQDTNVVQHRICKCITLRSATFSDVSFLQMLLMSLTILHWGRNTQIKIRFTCYWSWLEFQSNLESNICSPLSFNLKRRTFAEIYISKWINHDANFQNLDTSLRYVTKHTLSNSKFKWKSELP